MHVAPLVVMPYSRGHDGWVETASDLVTVLEDHPGLPLTLRVPGAAVEHLARDRPELWEHLTGHGPMWLAGGWSDPILADLPETTRRQQLSREEMAMDSAGIAATGLWVAGGWEPAVASLARSSDHPLVVMPRDLVEEVPPRPGGVDRAGDTVTVFVAVPAIEPARHYTPNDGNRDDDNHEDGLAVVSVDVSDLDRLARRHQGCLLTPAQYLEHHLPGPRLRVATSGPDRSGGAEVFYRRLLLSIAGQPGLDALFSLQSIEHLSPGSGQGLEAAHRRLIEARSMVDRARHRGESWVTVELVDWDADGMPEVLVETAAASLVIDPAHGTLDLWDDKANGWPISAVEPTLRGTLVRRMEGDGTEPAVTPLRLDRKSEGRAEARLTLVDEDGTGVRVILKERALTVELTVAPTDPMRVGPELPILLDASTTKLRVDGGDWLCLDEPVAVSGHRFRFTDETSTMVVSVTRPAEMFVRPLPGRELVVWPHWLTTGDAAYAVTFTPT